MIHCTHLSLRFGTQTIFDDLNFVINNHDKIGLVGLNGSGKSTLLKVIAGHIMPDEGTISIVSSKRIAYMPQEVVLSSQRSVIDEAMTAHHDIDATDEQRLRAEAKRILMGLGFTVSALEKAVCDLSVGWRMRVVLAQLLLQKADFYLFDEPTNHLDIVSKAWFLDFLKHSSFGFMLVSHDRYFLDHVVHSIVELEDGHATFFRGTYTAFEQYKKDRYETLHAQMVQQQKDIARKRATIDRFRASASKASMAQSMLKSLEKMEIVTIKEPPPKAHFSFPHVPPSGRHVLEVNNAQQMFDHVTIFKNISFSIERGERVALIAANGVGKTTLLHLIAGRYVGKPDTIKFGYNVQWALFEQDQQRALDPKKTIWEEVTASCPPTKTESTVRSLLGAFLFPRDTIYKKIAVLSGGERNRVAMVKLLLQDANFLLLDEPTNHLDMYAQDILLQALLAYTGTLLFVSHDQNFVNALATRIIELTPTAAYSYVGNYDDYLYQKKMLQEQQAPKTSSVAPAKPSVVSFEERKKTRALEQKIEKVEKELKRIEGILSAHEFESTTFQEAYKKHGLLQKELDALVAEWEKIMQS